MTRNYRTIQLPWKRFKGEFRSYEELRCANKLMHHYDSLDVAPPFAQWPFEMEVAFYDGVGTRRRRYSRYKLARQLVLMGTSPETACMMACTHTMYDEVRNRPYLRVDNRRTAVRWRAQTAQMMRTSEWGRRQVYYYDILAEEFVRPMEQDDALDVTRGRYL
jgi:hypothetical protein